VVLLLCKSCMFSISNWTLHLTPSHMLLWPCLYSSSLFSCLLTVVRKTMQFTQCKRGTVPQAKIVLCSYCMSQYKRACITFPVITHQWHIMIDEPATSQSQLSQYITVIIIMLFWWKNCQTLLSIMYGNCHCNWYWDIVLCNYAVLACDLAFDCK